MVWGSTAGYGKALREDDETHDIASTSKTEPALLVNRTLDR